MQILLDTCVAGLARDALVNECHDVLWGGEWSDDPGDAEILRRACAESRVLITLDKDFGELSIVQGLPHCGIIRLAGLSSREQGPACVGVLRRYGAELAAGAIVTVERGRVRVRPGGTGT
jgi:predicted nuclease of predicted toxin-antitoxin system